jgi:hypothetical protein
VTTPSDRPNPDHGDESAEPASAPPEKGPGVELGQWEGPDTTFEPEEDAAPET